MSREDVVAIALRLFAIFLLLSALRFVGVGVMQLDPDGVAGNAMAWVLLVAVPMLAVAALLWFFPLTLASRLLPVMREPRPALRADALEVEGVALTVLGLWVLADALTDAAYYVTFLSYVSRMEAPPWDEVPAETIAGLATTGVEIVIALWLLIGSRGWLRVLRRGRYAGSAGAAASAHLTDVPVDEHDESAKVPPASTSPTEPDARH